MKKYNIIIGFIIVIFSITSNAQTGKSSYPIIFVHGLNSNDLTWSESIDSLCSYTNYSNPYDNNGIFHAVLNSSFGKTQYSEDVKTTFSNQYNSLSANDIFCINFNNAYDSLQNEIIYYQDYNTDGQSESNESAIFKQGFALKQMIEKVLTTTGAEKVILFGHSMGGLAIREYLQRKNSNGNYKWWINPADTNYGHKVAKFITIGTPHGGSDLSDVPDILADWLAGIDNRSEAVRDIRNGNSTEDTGIYLFGGNENDSYVNNPYNMDVNCDGDELDNIEGINNLYLPTNIEYTWIVSLKTLTGDGVVKGARQMIGNYGDTIKTNQWHTDEPSDIYSIIRGLDEPDTYSFAYNLFPTNTSFISYSRKIKGFITYQPFNIANDIDYYKVKVTNDGNLQIIVSQITFENGVLILYDNNQNVIEAVSHPNMSGVDVEINRRIASGTYYISFTGDANPTSWQKPYLLTVNFNANGLPATVVLLSPENGSSNVKQPIILDWEDADSALSYNLQVSTNNTFSNIIVDADSLIESNYLLDNVNLNTAYFWRVNANNSFGTNTWSEIWSFDTNLEVVNLSNVEYYFDNDPGFGNGIQIPITSSDSILVQENIDISTLPIGSHRLYFRAKDENNNWGISQFTNFLVQEVLQSDTIRNITAVEYYFDDDPSFGSGNPISVSSSDSILVQENIDISTLPIGSHRLYFRAKDEDNNWGTSQFTSFLVQNSTQAEPLSTVTEIEYFYNYDPGFGSADSIVFTSGTDLQIEERLFPNEILEIDSQTVYIRAKTLNGWGITQSHTFYADTIAVLDISSDSFTDSLSQGATDSSLTILSNPGDINLIYNVAQNTSNSSTSFTEQQNNIREFSSYFKKTSNKRQLFNSFNTQVTDTGYADWYIYYPIDGVVNPGDSSDLIVEFDATGLSPGLYTDTLLITTNDPNNGVVKLPIELEVGEGFIALNIKTFLEGPYSSQSMSTSLNTQGNIPLNQPYNTAPWNYSGDESVTSIPPDIVDWVLVELRTGTQANTVVKKRAAFIRNNGWIVNTDGTSPVSFSDLAVGDYYIVVYHRNHIAIMSKNAVTLESNLTSNLPQQFIKKQKDNKKKKQNSFMYNNVMKVKGKMPNKPLKPTTDIGGENW